MKAITYYLVGGAVRDKLLGRPVKERDWVVVGATPEDLTQQGFKPVGKDFPVFLHPETKEEYALARTERKTGRGYKGFECHATANTTLEEDLLRRDLTINAMAETHEGNIIDLFGGQQDLANKCLRHVSPAFTEDPVRILRIARFAARLPDFDVAPETNQLMKQMVEKGEVDALVPQRVWKELSRALAETAPYRFFQVLENCNALPILFPGLSNQLNTALAALKRATTQSEDPVIRLAATLHCLSERESIALYKHYTMPKKYAELAAMTNTHYSQMQNVPQMTPEQLIDLIETLDAQRRPKRFQLFLTAVATCYPEKIPLQRLEKAHQAVVRIRGTKLYQQGLRGLALAKALRQKKIQAISTTLS